MGRRIHAIITSVFVITVITVTTVVDVVASTEAGRKNFIQKGLDDYTVWLQGIDSTILTSTIIVLLYLLNK